MDNKIRHNTGLQISIVTTVVIINKQMNKDNIKGIVATISHDVSLVFLNCYFAIYPNAFTQSLISGALHCLSVSQNDLTGRYEIYTQ